ncbi:MAG: flagellar basal body L-ring protein FlgH [Veillonellales bacterium]
MIRFRLTGLLLAGLLALSFPLANSAQADSLWSDNGSASSLFADHKAHAVGDIVTILINETSSATRAGSASNSKNASTTMSAGTGIFHGIAAASAADTDSFTAKGTIANTNVVTGTMTAVITEVKPNGNMVISGTQSIKQNGEAQKITVVGTIRSEDITSSNTIYSSYIANAQIFVDGKGPIAGKQRQGIVSQLFNFLF